MIVNYEFCQFSSLRCVGFFYPLLTISCSYPKKTHDRNFLPAMRSVTYS